MMRRQGESFEMCAIAGTVLLSTATNQTPTAPAWSKTGRKIGKGKKGGERVRRVTDKETCVTRIQKFKCPPVSNADAKIELMMEDARDGFCSLDRANRIYS